MHPVRVSELAKLLNELKTIDESITSFENERHVWFWISDMANKKVYLDALKKANQSIARRIKQILVVE